MLKAVTTHTMSCHVPRYRRSLHSTAQLYQMPGCTLNNSLAKMTNNRIWPNLGLYIQNAVPTPIPIPFHPSPHRTGRGRSTPPQSLHFAPHGWAKACSPAPLSWVGGSTHT